MAIKLDFNEKVYLAMRELKKHFEKEKMLYANATDFYELMFRYRNVDHMLKLNERTKQIIIASDTKTAYVVQEIDIDDFGNIIRLIKIGEEDLA